MRRVAPRPADQASWTKACAPRARPPGGERPWSAAQGEVFVEDQTLPSVTIVTRGLSDGLVLDGNLALPASGSTLLALAAGPHTLADVNNPAAGENWTGKKREPEAIPIVIAVADAWYLSRSGTIY